MPGRPAHIHFGPSKLGLGLILPSTLELEMEVHLIGREGEASPRGFGVSLLPSAPLRLYEVDSFEGPQTFADMAPEIAQIVASKRPLLITSTLRGAIADRYQLISQLLRARNKEGETVFVACENSPDPLYERLRAQFEPAGVQFLKTMVNRICPRFLTGHDPRRIVRAHRIGEWVLQRPPVEGEVTSLLERGELVSFVEDLAPYERRKRWLVNGGQMQLAILAHSAGKRSLRAAANKPGLRDPVNHFHAEANRVLEGLHPELEGNLEYALEHVVAFCEITDNVGRVLGLKRGDLAPFFRSFERRFAEPARLARELGGEQKPEIFTQGLLALEKLLEENQKYDWRDAKNPRKRAVLSTAKDREAVDAYAKMLEGWVPSASIPVRTRRLESILSSHRDAEEPVNHRLKPAPPESG